MSAGHCDNWLNLDYQPCGPVPCIFKLQDAFQVLHQLGSLMLCTSQPLCALLHQLLHRPATWTMRSFPELELCTGHQLCSQMQGCKGQ